MARGNSGRTIGTKGIVRKVVAPQFPYGRQSVGVIRPSTGIYGKKVGGGKADVRAVKQRGRR